MHTFSNTKMNAKRSKFLLQDEFYQMSIGNAPISKAISCTFCSHTRPTRLNMARMTLFLKQIHDNCNEIFSEVVNEIKS
jgi:hypothetical protein